MSDDTFLVDFLEPDEEVLDLPGSYDVLSASVPVLAARVETLERLVLSLEAQIQGMSARVQANDAGTNIVRGIAYPRVKLPRLDN